MNPVTSWVIPPPIEITTMLRLAARPMTSSHSSRRWRIPYDLPKPGARWPHRQRGEDSLPMKAEDLLVDHDEGVVQRRETLGPEAPSSNATS